MEFDEYDYLERTVENPAIGTEKDHRSSGVDGGERSSSRRSRSKEQNGGERSDGEDHRRRSRDDERDHDKDRDRRIREKDYDDHHRRSSRGYSKDRDYEREREREGGRRSSSRVERERDYERERERERNRRSSSRAERERDYERERERERSRRSSSRREREDEIERERARSRDRRARERELEMMERERRRFKERKESVEPEADPERDQRTVFAYQMPLKAKERDVYEFFSQAGKVRDVRLIMDRISRRSKGVGYIEFYDAMSVPHAIALSGHLLLGQPVMVKPSEAEKNLVQSNTAAGSGVAGAASERKLYVGNLNYNMNEALLRQIFEAFGPVELVQLPLDPDTGHCKGYGFIQFAQLEHAKAARNLNGTLDIAGRTIKVSAVTDHVGGQNVGTNAADFDDEDGGGLALNARSRAMLMQKLDRTGTFTSIAESLGIPGLNGTVANQPTPGLNAQGLPVFSVPSEEPSECLVLKNMFDPSEPDPEFYVDIKEEVEEECSKFGPVKHIFVDKNSSGFVYLRFESAGAAACCQRAMDKRWYAGRAISATFMRPYEYEARVGSNV